MHGVATFDGIGMDEVVAKSRSLSQLFVRLADDRLARHGFRRSPARASAAKSAAARSRSGTGTPTPSPGRLRAEGVVADFRSPDILRFGVAPLYIRHVDVWDAVDALARIMASEGWKAHGTATPDPVT